MSNESILSIADQHFRSTNPGGNKWTFNKIFYGPFIPEKKLNTARQSYATFNPREETPILLYDDTAFGSGKKGFLITNETLYYLMSTDFTGKDAEASISLAEISSFRIQVNKMSSDVFVNNRKIGNITQISRAEALVVEDFFGLLDSALSYTASETIAATVNPELKKDEATDIMGKIKQLKELLDMEAITKEEFDTKKSELLARL
jgi:hypothetical protein